MKYSGCNFYGGIMERCCEKMRGAIERGNIVTYFETYTIYGKPDFVDDGDNRTDNITAEMNIAYCPFCGKKLSKGGQAAHGREK